MCGPFIPQLHDFGILKYFPEVHQWTCILHKSCILLNDVSEIYYVFLMAAMFLSIGQKGRGDFWSGPHESRMLLPLPNYRLREISLQKDVIAKWQRSWNWGAKWTRKLIPNIQNLIERKTGEIFHGCFHAFLQRIGNEESRICKYCGKNFRGKEVIIYATSVGSWTVTPFWVLATSL